MVGYMLCVCVCFVVLPNVASLIFFYLVICTRVVMMDANDRDFGVFVLRNLRHECISRFEQVVVQDLYICK